MIADASWVPSILSRWVHVLFACLLVGGTFFLAFLLPESTAEAEPLTDESLYLRSRRRFKRVVHAAVLFLLLSGTYNAISNWPAYHRNIPLTHALFGPHLLLGLIVFVMLMVMLARKHPRPRERKTLGIVVLLLFLTVLVASALKYAREHPKAQQTTSYSIG